MICQHASPNFGPRRDGLRPQFVVVHYTAMASAQAALERLCDPVAEVSAHYLIGADGSLWQMVAEADRAWHAGAGSWKGLRDINSRSIGIELDNNGSVAFPEPLMARLEGLLEGILRRWSIPAEHVIGHSDMAPGRKIDPGPLFDWPRLAARGLAAARPVPVAGPLSAFRARAEAVGYCADIDDEALLEAVRLRWRPEGTGPLCQADVAALPAVG